MRIQLLAPQVANQIAAGEVVERPSAVVKELMENALDSGAGKIAVEIVSGGAKKILVRDNGCGIPRDELELALKRHATSKLSTIKDLDHLMSMGFRGEALASVAAVSRLTLTSKPADQDMAYAVAVEGISQEPKINPASHPDGTSVEVLDLFFNTPARRRFLKTEKTEFSQIEEMFRRLAVSRPDVAFTLKHNNRTVYDLKAVPDNILKRIEALLGRGLAADMKKVERLEDGLALRGYVTIHNQNKPVQYFFVNNRIVKDKVIIHAIKDAYESVTGVSADVSYVCFLDISPEEIDINVHPQKFEIRFHQAKTVHDFINTAFVNAFITEQQVLPETMDETAVSKQNHNYGNVRPLRFNSEKVSAFWESMPLAGGGALSSGDSPGNGTGENAAGRIFAESGKNGCISDQPEGAGTACESYKKLFALSGGCSHLKSEENGDCSVERSGNEAFPYKGSCPGNGGAYQYTGIKNGSGYAGRTGYAGTGGRKSAADTEIMQKSMQMMFSGSVTHAAPVSESRNDNGASGYGDSVITNVNRISEETCTPPFGGEVLPGGSVLGKPAGEKKFSGSDLTDVLEPWNGESLAECSLYRLVFITGGGKLAVISGNESLRIVSVVKLARAVFMDNFENNDRKCLESSALTVPFEFKGNINCSQTVVSLLGELGFAVSIRYGVCRIDAVPASVRGINLTVVMEKLITLLSENAGVREAMAVLADILFELYAPSTFSKTMVQRLVQNITYEKFFTEKMPDGYEDIDFSGCIERLSAV